MMAKILIGWCKAAMRLVGARMADGLMTIALLALVVLPVVAAPARPGVVDDPCPPDAIAVEPGASIQLAVDRAGEGAAFCLKNGIHRMQVVRPKPGQSFRGEGQTVLNGSRMLENFDHIGSHWVARGQTQRGKKHGECSRDSPACNSP